MKAAVHIFLLPLLGMSLAALQLNEAASAYTVGTCYSKPDNTVLAVEGSCTTYIYCLSEQAIVLPCPKDTAFSTSANGCIETSQADCFLQNPSTTPANSPAATCVNNEQRPENQAACEGKKFGDLVPYPGNCSLFLVCNCEYPTVKICPGGTWFNPDIEVCDWPQNVPSCGGTGNTTASTQPTNATPTQTIPTTNIPSETCDDLPAGLTGTECLRQPNYTLLRYPYNCSAYINCTLECPVLNYCIPGKVFNDILKICDTPDTAQCEVLQLPTTTESTIPTTEPMTTTTEKTTSTTELTTKPTETTTPESTTSTTEATTQSTSAPCVPPVGIEEDICQNENGFLQGYPYNCNVYINCTDGCPRLNFCEPDLVYNSILQICDTPDTEYCKEESLPSSTSPPTATQPPVTLPPDMDEICQNKLNGTLIPDDSDCASFIKCIDGRPQLQQCPNGWLFNPSLLICDYPKDVNCNSQLTSTTSIPTSTTPVYELCVGEKKDITFPDIYNCQQYYYCWGNDTSSLLSCPSNNWYNPYTGNCGPDVTPTACREPVTTSTTSLPTTQNPETMCVDQEFGKTFAVPSNCNLYYFCIGNNAPVILQCPSNNYYDPLSGNCDLDSSVCPQQPPTDTTTISIPTTPATQTASTSTLPTTEQTSTPPPTSICGNNNDGNIWPYPDSCTKYIVCQEPAPIALECPNDWYFNAATKQCDYQENVECDVVPGNTTTTTTISPGGSTTTTTVGPTDNTCMGSLEGQRLPYDKNCQLFIECLGSNLWMYKGCPAGEYYDPGTSQCGSDVAATACHGTKPPPTEPTGPCAGIADGSMVPYPNNCSKYIICSTPIPTGHECDLGLEFNAATQQCTAAENADCSIKTTTTASSSTTVGSECLNATSWDTFPYPDDCSMYIICNDGKQQLVPCVKGYYNPDTRMCDIKVSETYCTGNDNGTHATTDSTGTITPTMSPGSTTTVSTPGFPNGPCYNQSKEGTLVEYPNNCSKYIICIMPIPIGYDCPPDLEFNKESMHCEAPELANCGQKTSTTPLPESTTPIISTTDSTTEICKNAENGETFPYPPDCSQYIICINGEPIQAVCINDNYYNPSIGRCDKVSNTACREPVESTTTTTAENTPTPTIETTTPSTTTLNPYTPNVCCGIPLGTSVSYPNACDRYVYCDYPVPIVVYCSSGQIFDSKQRICVRAAEGQCVSSGTHDNVNETTLDPSTQTTFNKNLGTTLDPTESTTEAVHRITLDSTSDATTKLDSMESTLHTTLESTSRKTSGFSTMDPPTQATIDPTTGTTVNTTSGITLNSTPRTSVSTSGTSFDQTLPGFTTDPISGTTLDPTPGATSDPTSGITWNSTPRTSSPTSGTTSDPTSSTTLDPTPGATSDPTSGITWNSTPRTSVPTFGTTLGPTPGATSDPTSGITWNSTPRTSVPTSGTTLDPTPGATSDPTSGITWNSTPRTSVPTSGTTLHPTPGATSDPTSGITWNSTPRTSVPTSGTTLHPTPGATSDYTSGITWNSTPRTSGPTSGTTLHPTPGATSDYTSGITWNSTPRTSGPTSGTTLHPTPGATSDYTSGITWNSTPRTSGPTSGTTLHPTPGATSDYTSGITWNSTPRTSGPTSGTTLHPTPGATSDYTSGITWNSTPRTSGPTSGTTLHPTPGVTSDYTSGITWNSTPSTSGPTSGTTLHPTPGATSDYTSGITWNSTPSTSGPTTGTTLHPTPGATSDYTSGITWNSTPRTSGPTSGTTLDSTPPGFTTDPISSTTLNPTPGATSDPTTSLTTPQDYDTMNAQMCVNARAGTQKQYVGDCTKYNFCFGNQSMVLSCSTNWYYSPKLNECVPMSHYNCPW